MAILAFLFNHIADLFNYGTHVVVHRIDALELLMLKVPGEIIIKHSFGRRAENLISNGQAQAALEADMLRALTVHDDVEAFEWLTFLCHHFASWESLEL